MALHAVWAAGGVAVPLCWRHTAAELRHVFHDAQPAAIVSDGQAGALEEAAIDAQIPVIHSSDLAMDTGDNITIPLSSEDPALIVYTSGTTGKPKGAVHSHRALWAQVRMLCSEWEYTSTDHLLHFLPLHHVHGLINALLCVLHAGGCVTFLDRFDPTAVWTHLAEHPYSLLMGVPTHYAMLLDTLDAQPRSVQQQWRAGAARLRLVISGSMGLPPSLRQRWFEETGHTMLERYGTTETGMVLSQPLHGTRHTGTVGVPLPQTKVRIVDDELRVKSPFLFSGYWNNETATRSAMDEQGYYRTGDTVAVQDSEYRIRGRTNTDIFQSGGYKLSALEIEAALLECPWIHECAIVSEPDPRLGRAGVAVVVLRGKSLDDAQAWAKQRLAPYKLPRRWVEADALPRNAMGKVIKSQL